ncbi:MAG: hypothetical protein Q8L48_03285 [Archangium sp.]|nr:hypothetical protein [Archangium sp.]
MKPRFFATPADFRAWLEQHHATETILIECCAAGLLIPPQRYGKPKAPRRISAPRT